MELAFASLHQLCAPLLEAVEQLPPPQRGALEVAFGRTAGPAPDRFLVGLAVLTLLSGAAEERPLLCVVDDAQWLDEVSAKTLAFIARRLLAEPVGLLVAARTPVGDLRGLPELEVLGLRNGDARALLRSGVMFRLDERIRDRIVAETRGNPLALLELPRGLSVEQLAGGFGLLDAPRQALPTRLEESFQHRVEAIPAAAADSCCSSPPPSRSATRCSSGVQPNGSGSRLPRLTPRMGCSRSRNPCGSVIRSFAPRSTDPRQSISAGVCTSHWQRRPIGKLIQTVGHGIWPRPPPHPTRRSRVSWNDPPAARRRAEASPPLPRSCSAPSD